MSDELVAQREGRVRVTDVVRGDERMRAEHHAKDERLRPGRGRVRPPATRRKPPPRQPRRAPKPQLHLPEEPFAWLPLPAARVGPLLGPATVSGQPRSTLGAGTWAVHARGGQIVLHRGSPTRSPTDTAVTVSDRNSSDPTSAAHQARPIRQGSSESRHVAWQERHSARLGDPGVRQDHPDFQGDPRRPVSHGQFPIVAFSRQGLGAGTRARCSTGAAKAVRSPLRRAVSPARPFACSHQDVRCL